MNAIERIVRIFHESWTLRDPERGGDRPHRRIEDMARAETQIGPEGYLADYERWRAAFPGGGEDRRRAHSLRP